VHVDQSAKDEQEGLQYTFVTSGTRKADLTPHRPISSAAREELQDRVDQVYALTAATVARHRGISEEVLDRLQGGVVFGEEALEVGLASKIQSKQEAIEQFLMDVARNPGSRLMGSQQFNGGRDMAKPKTTILQTPKDSTAAGQAAPQGEPEKAAQAQAEGQLKGTMDQGSETSPVSPPATGLSGELSPGSVQLTTPETFAASYVMDVMGACRMAGRPELAEKFIEKRIPLDAVRSALQNAQAQADEAIKIVGTPPPEPEDGGTKAQTIDAAGIFAARKAQMSGRA
jgi:hypothetical protein